MFLLCQDIGFQVVLLNVSFFPWALTFTYVLIRGFQNRLYGQYKWARTFERIVNKINYVNIIMRIPFLEWNLTHPVFCYAISSRSLLQFSAVWSISFSSVFFKHVFTLTASSVCLWISYIFGFLKTRPGFICSFFICLIPVPFVKWKLFISTRYLFQQENYSFQQN